MSTSDLLIAFIICYNTSVLQCIMSFRQLWGPFLGPQMQWQPIGLLTVISKGVKCPVSKLSLSSAVREGCWLYNTLLYLHPHCTITVWQFMVTTHLVRYTIMVLDGKGLTKNGLYRMFKL